MKIAEVDRNARQRQAHRWGAETFGIGNVINVQERARRFLEEAIELAQAVGLDHGQVRDLARHVYAKPPGDFLQEAGGAGVTLLVLCEALGISADCAEVEEINRVLNIDPDHFRKRHAIKVAAGVGMKSESLVTERARAEAATY